MRTFVTALMVALVVAAAPAQTRQKTAAKTTVKQSARKKGQTKKTTTKKKTAAKKKTSKKGDAQTYTTAEIRGLQQQKSNLQQQIRKQEQALRANQADVKKRLGDLLIINSEIDKHQKNIDGIQQDITHIDGNIKLLRAQLNNLEQQLAERKAKYVKSMRYVARKHTLQERLMFILSAKDLAQMYRRMRFVREYAAYQRAQGEMVKTKQAQVNDKHQQLEQVKGHKSNLLYKGQQERKALEGKQVEQQKVVNTLQKQQKTIQQVIAKQRKDAASINAQIDKLVAEEVAKARARAEAEAKRKAAEAAAAAKRRAEELARKRAEAEKARQENERRIAEARERERAAKEAARAAAEREAEAQRQRTADEQRTAAAQKAVADQKAREAEADRLAAERKAKADEQRNKKEIADASKAVEQTQAMTSVDRMMSGGFEANRGRLPMPITGNYRVVSHFGQNSVEGLKGVTIDNKGINIMGSPGCQARAIYDGEVSAVFGFGGSMVVMVRHGIYISVYCNLRSVNVHRGQKVSTRQALGAVASDNILQFQLRRNMDKLNPESWLGR